MGPARLAAPAAVMAVLWWLSSTPDLGTGLEDWDLLLRKAGHAAAYATLALSWAWALGRERLALALALSVAYAALDELHQSWVPTRHGSALDVAIDAAGALLGLLALRRWSRRERVPARASRAPSP
jgi:VanZ family protein